MVMCRGARLPARSVVSMSGDPVTLLDWRCRMDGAFAAARAASAPAEGQCPLATPGNAVPARVATRGRPP